MSSNSYFSDVASLVRIASFKYHDEVAFTYQASSAVTGSLTYADLDSASALFAQYLTEELGLQRGERVAVMLSHCLALPPVYLGIMRAGLVLVPIESDLEGEEFEAQVRASAASVLVVPEAALDRVYHVFESSSVRTFVTASPADFLPLSARMLMQTEALFRGQSRRSRSGAVSLRDILRRMQRQETPVARWEVTLPMGREVALVRMGGVGSGRPITHAEIARRVSSVAAGLGDYFDAGQDTVVSLLPQHRNEVFASGFLTYFWLGVRNVFVGAPGTPQALRGVLERQRPTWMTVAAETAESLLDQEWASSLLRRSLRGAVVDGLTVALRDAWMERIGVPLIDPLLLEPTSDGRGDPPPYGLVSPLVGLH